MNHDNAASLSLATSPTSHADALASSTHLPPARFFEDGTALNRLLLEAPYLARCSDDKTATRVRPREYALRYPYMQVNRPGMVSWLVFDLDHANALAWDDAGLPAPNLMVRNRKSGHSQLFYAVPSVCTTENARAKPIQYMKAIYAAFAARLDADVDYHGGPVAKTPGHPWWETTEFHSHVYELGELASAVELTVKPWATGPKLDQVSHSRH
ncbi:replication initiation protein, partial [Pseudomonas avellanae]